HKKYFFYSAILASSLLSLGPAVASLPLPYGEKTPEDEQVMNHMRTAVCLGTVTGPLKIEKNEKGQEEWVATPSPFNSSKLATIFTTTEDTTDKADLILSHRFHTQIETLRTLKDHGGRKGVRLMNPAVFGFKDGKTKVAAHLGK